MEETNLIPEKDVFGLEKPDELSPLNLDPERASRTIRFTVILLVVAVAIATLLYFLQS